MLANLGCYIASFKEAQPMFWDSFVTFFSNKIKCKVVKMLRTNMVLIPDSKSEMLIRIILNGSLSTLLSIRHQNHIYSWLFIFLIFKSCRRRAYQMNLNYHRYPEYFLNWELPRTMTYYMNHIIWYFQKWWVLQKWVPRLTVRY